MENARRSKDSGSQQAELPLLTVTYFTDPLCCWSWGMQPHLDQLQKHYGEALSVSYKMGGMLPSWEHFFDEANAVSRPIQMGPVWMHAAQLTGRSIDHHLWVKDPPVSSYPACIAVKSAGLQSDEAGIVFFKRLQQAAMEEGKNIASWPVIKAIATGLSITYPSFALQRFAADYEEKGIEAFRDDLAMITQYRITRFPTLMIYMRGQKGIVLPGFRTFEGMLAAIEQAFS